MASTEEILTQEEHAAAVDSQTELKTYDPSLDEVLSGQLVSMFAKHERKFKTNEMAMAGIRAAAGTKNFPNTLQYESKTVPEVRTLGELAESRANEHAQQFLYVKSIDKILFGKYGLVKGKKLSSDIQICYRRGRDGELKDFVITSGRHRVVSIIALLQHLGIQDWQSQKVQVTTKVVSSDPEFAQLIETANDSRRMPRAEQQVYGLTSRGVRTKDRSEFYETRTQATDSQLGHVFAKAVQFELEGMPQTTIDAFVSCVGSAWNKCKSVGDNSKLMRAVIHNEDTALMQDAARKIAGSLPTYATRAVSEIPGKTVNTACSWLCAADIANVFGLQTPEVK